MSRSTFLSVAVLFLTSSAIAAESTVTFEDLGLKPNSFDNGDPSGPNSTVVSGGSFVSGGSSFNNSYDATYGAWFGWAASSMTDTTTPGFTNQYSAITGIGADGSQTYAVADTFGDDTDAFHPAQSYIDLTPGMNPVSIQITNTTYAYFSMLNGDTFESPFGSSDFFLLDIKGFTGLDGTGSLVGDVPFYLADGTSFVTTWTTVGLSTLSGATSLQFELTSSENDPVYGQLTPSTFAIDNLVLATPVPEPPALLLASLAGAAAVAGLVRRRRHRQG